MKSLANDLLTVSLGLCEDIRVAYPEYGFVEKDKTRLTLLSKTRGLGFFSLDLPALDTMLTNGLKSGRLIVKGHMCKQVSSKIKVPRFLSGLWLRVFDRNACLKPDADETAIFFLRQIFCLGKKMVAVCTPDRVQNAVKEYHIVESSIRVPSLLWDADSIDPDVNGPSLHFCDGLARSLPLLDESDDLSKSSEADRDRIRALAGKLQYFCDSFSERLRFFEPVSYSGARNEVSGFTGFKHGPGAVASRSKSYKYDFAYWPAKLQEWFPYEECAIHNLRADTHVPRNHELASRLIAVPKTAKVPRLIASEPVEHQWCQQLMLRFLEEEYRRIFQGRFIDFRDQAKSQAMTRTASLTGDLATVDLSSASDRLSCWVVERVFRKNRSVLHSLHASRTRWMRDDISSPPIFFKKKKFASQGAAVTFPVQTLVFLLCVLSVLDGKTLEGSVLKYGRSVQVFGDDIILPKEGYADLVILLGYLGLKVNEEKSFATGKFRESCGFDGYNGYDVTPVKPLGLSVDGPSNRVSLVDTSNNFFRKGCWHAAEAVKSTAGNRSFMDLLPVMGRFDAGTTLSCFSGYDFSHLRKRWNSRYQRYEVRSHVVKDKVTRKSVDSTGMLLQYFTERRSVRRPLDYLELELTDLGTTSRPRSSDGPGWAYYPEADMA